LFTSDYALYWFDYLGGYDVVLAQLGWNYSRQLNIALCRGAATVHDRDWGVIVTWTYNEPPYLGSGEELFDACMHVLAYENGARYALVFDSDENYTHSTLSQEHLDALERFWQYTKEHPRPADLLDGRVAFVACMHAELSGGSSLSGDFTTSGDTQFTLSGGSHLIKLEGAANDLRVSASSGSSLGLSEFHVHDASVNLSGGSQATINLDGRLDADLSGGSHLLYIGDPTMGDIDTSGGSTISRK